MIRFNAPLRLLPIALLAAALAGCGRGEDIKVYRVSKESTPSPQTEAQTETPQGSMPDGHPGAPHAQPQISWMLPDGWQELGPGKMSVASFGIRGRDGKEAQVTITPLSNLAGKEALIVNMWRMQAGLPELPEETVQKQLSPVQIGPDAGKMFEVTGEPSGTNAPIRILTAMAHRPDASWFYKITGDVDLVEAQKPAFISFLKSIKITESPAAEMAPAAAGTSAPAQSASGAKTPADWKTVEPGPMQAAKFAVEKGAAKAEVTVSIFPNSTGGALMNVNRWRGQIGLSPIAESELGSVAVPLDEKIPDSILADMSNGSTRLVGAIVPRDGQWYFYKLRGDADAVAAQKEAFVKFARSEP